jgi:glucan phosphoethanolaminetransferase (alkaline phosphatase superfamily)
MLQKLRNHFLLALVFFSLTLLQQYSFYTLKSFPIIWLSFGKYLTILFFFFIFTLIKGPKARFFVLSFFMLLNYFQMAHLSYFGTQILPNEIYLLFSDFHEVTGVVDAELQHVLIPLLFTLLPLALGYYFHRKLKTILHFKFVPALLILYFLYNPVRTYVTGNTWGRQPSTRELSGMNVYLSLSYFLGRILPHKLAGDRSSYSKNRALKLVLTKTDLKDWDNVIIVLGESLSPHQMSLYGYKRATTPYLDTLKNSPRFFNTIGLSSGVSTDISVAFFLNLGYGATGVVKAAKGDHCLFKSAKKSGFSTHFLSTQSGEQLRYITPYLCASSLDDYRSLESIAPGTENPNLAADKSLLPHLETLLKNNERKFIILHQRGSHAPWKLRSTPASTVFTNPQVDERINDYDNSVVEFDLFWKDLDTLLSQHKSKTLVIYLSDHGESLGKSQRWGHGFLASSSFEVPVMIQSFNKNLPENTLKLPRFLPQYNVGLFITQALGFDTNQSPIDLIDDYVIYGNDIDGFAGKAAITFDEKSYRFKPLP